MGYTALKRDDKQEAEEIERRYGKGSLEEAALRFIRERCQDLRFKADKEDEERTKKYTGTSLKPNQIPYNMQMDIDRLCLENAVKRFLKSGSKEDAFDIYFCYLEMFVGKYEKTRKMIELLSEFEANGSTLLMKHRDHYSHSAYVFVLGLAIYESNDNFRCKYEEYYIKRKRNLKSEKEVAWHYLEYWGLTSLFHDIGYPFEIPFEQICSYFEVKGVKREEVPYIAYQRLEPLINIDAVAKKALEKGGLYSDKSFTTVNELFAKALNERLGAEYATATEEQMCKDLVQKPTEPDKYNYYMDHAYFSAVVLFKKLFGEKGCGKDEIKEEHLDSLTAILMHNSLYKFCIAVKKDKKPFKAEIHPLAYMLMLCDELQCWDRIAYGRNSKQEVHPKACFFELSKDTIKATYLFDEGSIDKINEFKDKYIEWLKGPDSKEPDSKEPDERETEAHKNWRRSIPSLKAYSGMYLLDIDCVSTLCDIKRIVDTSEIKLEIESAIVSSSAFKKTGYLSSSNFINLYEFAVILHGRWDCLYNDKWRKAKSAGWERKFFDDNFKEFEEGFEKLSLEYKLSNINQAKAFERYLNKIGCFYTDKAVDFELLEEFTPEELAIIGPMEHQRWLQEHYDMGWKYGEKDKYKNVRDLERRHWDMIPGDDLSQGEVSAAQVEINYERIGKEEQDKDTEPMECMMAMLKMRNGVRIYRLPN